MNRFLRFLPFLPLLPSLPKRWFFSVFSIELRKIASYRSDFWITFLGTIIFQFIISYSLWSSLYDHPQQKIQGLSFRQMMLYYLLVPLLQRMIQGQQMGYFSTEIYSGELTRYLLYPVSPFQFKFATHLAHSFFSLLQFFIGLALFYWFFGVHQDIQLTPGNILLGLLLAQISSLLYYTLCTCLEWVAFWAEHVWTLMVMLRFISGLLGGAFLPLSLYPEWAQKILDFLPFHYLASFPILVIQGKIPFQQILIHIPRMMIWIILLLLLARWIWNKGTRSYTGVGI